MYQRDGIQLDFWLADRGPLRSTVVAVRWVTITFALTAVGLALWPRGDAWGLGVAVMLLFVVVLGIMRLTRSS